MSEQQKTDHTEQRLGMVGQPYGWIGKHSGEFIKNVGQGHVEGIPLYSDPRVWRAQPMQNMSHDQMVARAYGHPVLTKREWQGLTDEEIKQIEETTTCLANESWLRNLTRNIETKLKEKNHG